MTQSHSRKTPYSEQRQVVSHSVAKQWESVSVVLMRLHHMHISSHLAEVTCSTKVFRTHCVMRLSSHFRCHEHRWWTLKASRREWLLVVLLCSVVSIVPQSHNGYSKYRSPLYKGTHNYWCSASSFTSTLWSVETGSTWSAYNKIRWRDPKAAMVEVTVNRAMQVLLNGTEVCQQGL